MRFFVQCSFFKCWSNSRNKRVQVGFRPLVRSSRGDGVCVNDLVPATVTVLNGPRSSQYWHATPFKRNWASSLPSTKGNKTIPCKGVWRGWCASHCIKLLKFRCNSKGSYLVISNYQHKKIAEFHKICNKPLDDNLSPLAIVLTVSKMALSPLVSICCSYKYCKTWELSLV